MAERIADNAELIVDEMRRKARRRLVGAIVLALAAAIILPMLLEKEPRPLGDDVSVQIPPVDQGKFVNRLTGKAGSGPAPAKPDSKPITAGAGKTEPKVEAATEAPTAAAAPAAPPKTEATVAPKTEPADPPKTEPAAATAGVTKAEANVATAAPTSAAGSQGANASTPAVTPKPEAYVVQLAAFADDKGANALANKLKKGGYAAYVEPVNTSRGTLWRVRVGGYGTRPEADAARVALKGEGYSGIIAPSQ